MPSVDDDDDRLTAAALLSILFLIRSTGMSFNLITVNISFMFGNFVLVPASWSYPEIKLLKSFW